MLWGKTMGYKLLIYNRNAYKEYLLPAVNNADYKIHLERNLYDLSEDAELWLEVIDLSWHFVFSEKYSIVDEKRNPLEILQDGKQGYLTLLNGQQLHILVKESKYPFEVYTKYMLDKTFEITIGSEGENTICYQIPVEAFGQRYARIIEQEHYWFLKVAQHQLVYVNNLRVRDSRQMAFGDRIDLFGLTIVFLGNTLAINSNGSKCFVDENILPKWINDEKREGGSPYDIASIPSIEVEKTNFHRSPRKIYKIDSEPVEIEAPPQPRQELRKPLALIIGPSMTMALPMLMGSGIAVFASHTSSGSGGFFMYTGIVTALASAMIGTLWALINLNYEKKKTHGEELHRFELYGEYLIHCSELIKEKYKRNRENMYTMYASPSYCFDRQNGSLTLWNRNESHADFLQHRLGTGDLPFQVPIIVPKEKFTMVSDTLAEKPQLIQKSFAVLHDVPVCIDFAKHNLIGVIGGKGKQGAREVMYALVAQIATANCYTDVKMVFIYNEKRENRDDWRFAKWLPHTWNESRKLRMLARNSEQARDVFYELTQIMRRRLEKDAAAQKNKRSLPYYILFVEDAEVLHGELIEKYIFQEAEKCGISTMILEDSYENLPNECDYIIENSDSFCGLYSVTDNVEERIAVKFDTVTSERIEWFARSLAKLRVNETKAGGDLPEALTFFEMYGIHQPSELHSLERWKKNRTYETMRALIGQKSGGENCFLDIHEKYHGPHGLIAGTTGSGKSELLQTYLLSLALNYSPEDINFFLIDYKGGGMANLFDGLPHVIGQISNLSGNQIRRAMVSIKSENKKRQSIFNEYDVNNINAYTRLYKNGEAKKPIPHLFIIIDEFAELKREEPDFMQELISVAQVGRSLGVHLILATQKPSGTVDDNIWSNSKFRLCLRVQDKQDSNDMLHRSDAAYITQAGRCYLQVGNDELFELLQSGYSGAVYDKDELGNDEIATMLSDTGKAVFIGNYIKKEKKEAARKKWLSVLLQKLEETQKEGLDNEQIMSVLWKDIQQAGYEYTKNDYNLRCIQNLMTVYRQVQDREIDSIIAYAQAHHLKLPELKEKTQLEAVIDYLHKLADENDYQVTEKLWLPVLPEILCLNELNDYQPIYTDSGFLENKRYRKVQVPIGLYDDPANQTQLAVNLDFSENGHLAVIGMAATGKSTFLQTLLYGLTNSYSPKEVNFYIADFSTRTLESFYEMPHVGGIVFEDQEDRLSKMFVLLKGILEERKRLFKGITYNQFIHKNGNALPMIFLIIDNYANFRQKSAERYDDILLKIAKEGINYGVLLVLTAGGFGMAELPNRMAENIRMIYTLEMNDRFAYAEVLRETRLEILPETNIKGRGLARVGEEVLEYQTALALAAGDDSERIEKIKVVAQKMKKSWMGEKAAEIPEIPEKVRWKVFCENKQTQSMMQRKDRIPIGYDFRSAQIYGIDLRRTYCAVVSGKSGCGKKNFLKILMLASIQQKRENYLIDFKGELAEFADRNQLPYIRNDKEMFSFFSELMPQFRERNIYKRELCKNEVEDEVIFEEMQRYLPKVICIANLADFVRHIEKPEEGVGDMRAFVENLLDKGANHNVYWFAILPTEDTIGLSGNKLFQLFTRSRKGIHFGGEVSTQRILNFDQIPFTEQGKILKPGIGMIPSNEDGICEVVIPQVKG